MDHDQVVHIAILRAAVGLLGEKANFGYWSSKFFSAEAEVFLAPVFPRSHFLACLTGVTAAAARSHDERIGVGNVYHLFRLPEDVEQSLHALIGADLSAEIETAIASDDTATEFLQQHSSKLDGEYEGPARVAAVDSLRHMDAWARLAGHFLLAFDRRREVFPYFAGTQ